MRGSAPASPAEARICSGRDRRRASPAGSTTLPSGPRTRGPPPPHSSDDSPKAASRTCAPRGAPPAGRCVAAPWSGSPRGARQRPGPSPHARRQESSERHPSRSFGATLHRKASSLRPVSKTIGSPICDWRRAFRRQERGYGRREKWGQLDRSLMIERHLTPALIRARSARCWSGTGRSDRSGA